MDGYRRVFSVRHLNEEALFYKEILKMMKSESPNDHETIRAYQHRFEEASQLRDLAFEKLDSAERALVQGWMREDESMLDPRRIKSLFSIIKVMSP